MTSLPEALFLAVMLAPLVFFAVCTLSLWRLLLAAADATVSGCSQRQRPPARA